MEAAVLTEHLERLADWTVGGVAVLCALIALRAASHGSWLLRLILGPVAVGGVLAAFFAILVHRPPMDLGGTEHPGVTAAARERAPAEAPVVVKPEAVANAPAEPIAPVERKPPPTADAVAGPAGSVPETTPQRPLLHFATDRARADRDGQPAFGSVGAGRLELGRVQPGGPQRSAMARAPSTAASDADGGGERSAAAAPMRIETLDAAAWGEGLFKQPAGEGGPGERRVVVVVHGYDTGFDEAVLRATRLAERIQPGPPVVLFSWPSGSRVASYSVDRDSAARAAPFLAETLQVLASGGIRSLALVCDGLGCRVLLDALDRLTSAPASGASLAEVVMVAPDLEAAELARRVPVLAGFARGITLYADATDHGLDVSRRFNAGVLPAGGVAGNGPLVLPAMTTVDATGAADGAIARDIARLIGAGDRDPAARGLEPVRREGGGGGLVHWRLEGRR